MKTRLFRLGLAAIAGVAGLFLLGILFVVAAPATNVSAQPAPAPEGRLNSGLSARRIISIPFGIADELALQFAGRQIAVSGHGTCQEGGDIVRVRVTLTQDATGARAMGRTEENCTGELQTWDAVADAVGRAVFDPGDAQACALAIVFRPHGGAFVQQWCKDVQLVTLP